MTKQIDIEKILVSAQEIPEELIQNVFGPRYQETKEVETDEVDLSRTRM